MPMAPLAPGRLVTMTGCVVYFLAESANKRAITSVPPPGDEGTTNSMARDGYGAACAGKLAVSDAKAATAAQFRTKRRVFMVVSLCV